MKKISNKTRLSAAVVSMAIATGVGVTAYAKTDEQNQEVHRPTDEQIEELQEIVDNDDYEAWKEQVLVKNDERKKKADERISEEDFEQFKDKFGDKQAMHDAMESGDYETWVALMEEMHVEHAERAEEKGIDFPEMDTHLNEETFNTMQKAYELKEDGDYEGARAIMEEAGIEKQFAKGMHGKGMKGGGMHGGGFGGRF